mmetsp:Transcript_55187/g.151834  ORF Transcript_55187/g.151834 Transcript_55187/m.151834 type:complete len:219 (-) Transcript_55187:79-735(-)
MCRPCASSGLSTATSRTTASMTPRGSHSSRPSTSGTPTRSFASSSARPTSRRLPRRRRASRRSSPRARPLAPTRRTATRGRHCWSRGCSASPRAARRGCCLPSMRVAPSEGGARRKRRKTAQDGVCAEVPQAGEPTVGHCSPSCEWRHALRNPHDPPSARQVRHARRESGCTLPGPSCCFEYRAKRTPHACSRMERPQAVHTHAHMHMRCAVCVRPST